MFTVTWNGRTAIYSSENDAWAKKDQLHEQSVDVVRVSGNLQDKSYCVAPPDDMVLIGTEDNKDR